MLRIMVQKIDSVSALPVQSREGDAGYDLFANQDLTLLPRVPSIVATGIALAMPFGYAGFIWDRSGLSTKFGIKTLGGVIDAGYRGEVGVGLINMTDTPYEIKRGDRIAQLVIQEVQQIKVIEVETLPDTERGTSGFGSTGK